MTTINPAVRQAIRSELLKHAKNGSFPFYGQLGAPLGIPARWRSWKVYLDDISKGEIAAHRPDITWIVRSSRVRGLPGQMDMKKVEKSTLARRRRAKEKADEVLTCYCPGAPNPFDR